MVDGGTGRDTESHISCAGLEFAISLRMTLNFLTSCLHLRSARFAGVCHCGAFIEPKGFPIC